MKLSRQKKENQFMLVTLLPVHLSITWIGKFSLDSHVPKLHGQHVCTRFLHFCQWQMYGLYLYFYVQTHFSP